MPNMQACNDAVYYAYRGTCGSCGRRRLIRAIHAVRLTTKRVTLCGACDRWDHEDRERVRNMSHGPQLVGPLSVTLGVGR